MRRHFRCFILILTLLLHLTTKVYADNVTVLRSLYQDGEEVVMGSEELRNKYTDSTSVYSEVRESLKVSQQQQMTKLIILDQAWGMKVSVESVVDELTVNLNSTYAELAEAVDREFSLPDIYQIENKYQQIKAELSEQVKILSDLSTFLMVYDRVTTIETDVTEQELLDNFILMRQLQNDYAVALKYEDIGDVRNIKVPISTGKFTINSPFGLRGDPFGSGKYQNHYGLDLAAPLGAQVLAWLSGVVVVSDYSSTYGNYVIIDHGHNVKTLYGHASKNLVAVGDFVEQYQIIQDVGSTGASTGPHLHLALSIDGEFVDPSIVFTNGV